MTRFIHDQFAKQYLRELLSPLGIVETEKEIPSEVRKIDLYFIPTDSGTGDRDSLGLLGRFTNIPAVFEPFRNPVTKSDIRSCLGKLFSLHANLEREANRTKTKLNEKTLPQLWILTPTASSEILQSCHAFPDEENWGNGIYFLGSTLKSAIVVIHQLPRTSETLWLRLLGRGRVQQQAITELKALPRENRWRDNALELVYELISILAKQKRHAQGLDIDEEDLIMTLTEMYQEVIAELRQEMQEEVREEVIKKVRGEVREEVRGEVREEVRGEVREEVRGEVREEIEKQTQQNTIEMLLRSRFTTIDEELAEIIESILELPSEEFIPLLVQLSREELLARFSEA